MSNMHLKIEKEQLTFYLGLAIIYLIIALLFFWPLLNNMLPGKGGDAYQSAWELWWTSYALFVLHTSPYFTNYILFPVGANLITQTFAPLAGIIASPFEALGPQIALNFTFFLGFVLSGLFAYLLIDHLVHNKFAAFAGSLIYAFSPIHVVQALGHLQYTNIEFIPLFLLFFIEMIEHKRQRYAVYSAIAFIFLTFMGDIEQAIMAVLLVFFIILYMLARKNERQKIANKKFVLLLFEMILLILVLGLPAFIPIISGLHNALQIVNEQAGIQYNELYSPDVLSFFIPSLTNGLLHAIPEASAYIYKGDPAETTAYVGYIVLLLTAYALYKDYNTKFSKTGLYAFALLFFIWLSLGPYVWIGGKLTGIPGLYLIYHYIPILNVLREPGRFDIVSELMFAILFSYGLVELEKSFANYKTQLRYAVLIILLIEYFAMPTSASMVNSEFSSAYIPKAYYEIGKLPGNFSILLLPTLPNSFNATDPNTYPGLEMYYQTVFRKPLVGGYATRENATQVLSLTNIPLVASAYYLEGGQGLVYLSPLITNYTNATKFLLAAYNVTFIGIVRKAYTIPELENLSSYLYSIFGSPVYQSNTTIIFSTRAALQNVTKTAIAYTPVAVGNVGSIWLPGWEICTNPVYCNSTIQSMWWSVNPAFVEIYTPRIEKLSITVNAMALRPTTAYVYFDNLLAASLNLTTSPETYTINVTSLRAIINPLVFETLTNSSIGVKNITISVR